MVEFTMLAPVLIIIGLGIMQFGSIFFHEHAMYGARGRAAARPRRDGRRRHGLRARPASGRSVALRNHRDPAERLRPDQRRLQAEDRKRDRAGGAGRPDGLSLTNKKKRCLSP
ncbi:MAG: pilus assembly protein [Geminicoccaceae bacterium]|nr:pilus assembly protein [Geminicoccaceae bacterium]